MIKTFPSFSLILVNDKIMFFIIEKMRIIYLEFIEQVVKADQNFNYDLSALNHCGRIMSHDH